MALYADRVKDSTSIKGTGAITLSGTAPTGFQSFATAFGASPQTVAYCIADQTGNNWEVGTGVFNGTTGLTRVTVLASSNGGSLTNFSGGTQDVFCTAPAAYLLPAGSNTEIQFNNAGAFGASPNFTYDVTNRTLAIGPAGAATAILTTVTPTGSQAATALRFLGQPGTTSNGGGFSFVAGAAGTGGAGGAFTATGGTSTAGSGGGFTFTGGATTAAAVGGSFTVNTGAANSASGLGGNVTFSLATGASTGGRFQVTSGNGTAATNGAGGAVNLTAGNGVGTGVGGALNLTAGNAVNGAAGAMTFNAGSSSSASGGALTLNAGTGATTGGAISFTAGPGFTGGNMTFNAGTANGTGSGNTGGSITFSGGGSTSSANAGDLIFSGGACGSGSGSGFRGGNVVITSGSSDFGPAGSFTCQTALGSTGSGSVTFETGQAFGGKSGDINLITGVSGFLLSEDAGNLIYTGGATGSDDDDFSGTAGGGIFTGGYGSGSAGVGGSFTFTAGGGNATNGSINLATVSGTSIQLADNGARQLGFFGATPVAKPTGVAVTAAGIHAALVSLGLIS
jgi:hypothetical protein